jgi:hypothetical protein
MVCTAANQSPREMFRRSVRPHYSMPLYLAWSSAAIPLWQFAGKQPIGGPPITDVVDLKLVHEQGIVHDTARRRR